MNPDLNLDLDKVRALLRKLGSDLRGSRLWPLAVVLLAGIVTVPILLTKSSSSDSPAPAAAPVPSGTPSAAVPALDVQSTTTPSRLRGRGRDPFGAQNLGSSAAVATAGAQTSGSGTPHSASSSPTSTHGCVAFCIGSVGSSSAAPTSSTAAPPAITPANTKPTPAPAGLTSTESYDVALSITNQSGGLDAIDPLERLSVLPSTRQPLLVELGVSQRGGRVLFAVQPGTTVNGPGQCTPGPIDCEIMSLGQDQTEGVGVRSAAGTTQVAAFAITGITAVTHSSATAAGRARRQESAAGRKLLDASTADALSLFRYEPSVGAVVSLTTLTARDM